MIKDKNGQEIKVGDKVKHWYIKDWSSGEYHPDWGGTVLSMEPKRLPLIEVDCGLEFPRLIPNIDLIHA
jgi:hypothetical protein